MFWDGTRWVAERPTSRPPAPRRRLADAIATIPILLLVPLLLSPYLAARASDAALSVSGQAVPGGQIGVTGAGWQSRTNLQLTWDGSAQGMPSVRINARGTFATTVTVPLAALPAQHTLAVVSTKNGRNVRTTSLLATSSAQVLASVTVTVVTDTTVVTDPPSQTPGPTLDPVVTPPPDPTPTLGPPAPPEPTLAPTLPPTPDPTPTRAPTPAPDPTPTRAPTPPPDPTAPPGPTLTFAAECNGGSVPSAFRALYQVGDPGFGLDSDFMGDMRQVSAANGFCTITAERRSTPSGRAYASAAVATYGTFSQQYGTFEARIRYPKGAGVWPAFWLLADGSKQTPPEVDIFEAYPGPGTGSSGTSVAVFSNHYSGGTQYTAWDAGSSLTGAWHVWRFVWTPDSITVRVDGTKMGTLTGHVPNIRMYPILDLALGAAGYRIDGSTPASLDMDIDYLRVYAP